MAFPSSPANGQRASVNNIIYEYNDTKGAWLRVSAQGFTSANLTVGGLITDNYYRADGTSLLGVNKSVYNGTATASTSTTLIDSVPTAGNTSVAWSLTSKDTDNSTYKNSVVSSLNDGTNVYYSEYGIILSNASVSVSTFTSNIVSGNLRLYAVGDSANVTITFQRTLLGSSTDVGYITAGASGAQGPEGNIGNVNSTANVVTSGYFIGNGSQLTGLPISYGNTEVATYLTTYTGNIGNLKTTSNVITTGYFIGNGSQLTGIVTGSSYGNTEVATYLTTYTGNLSAGATTIGGNLTVSGNLIVNGNVTYINANNVNINDSLIYLADDNPADTLDIGFVSAFTDATRYQHTGIVRDATDGVWKLFANVVAEPTTTVDFTNANYSNLQIGTLIATAGTNSAPSITTTGDTNTGIFFPAADTMAFTEGGAEVMRIDSAGRVGIGTTSPTAKLEVKGITIMGNASAGTATYIRSAVNWNYSQLEITRNATNTSSPRFIGMSLDGDTQTSTTVGDYNGIWGLYDSAPTTGSTSSALNSRMMYGAYAGHIWLNNGTEYMRIASTGNVVISTNTASTSTTTGALIVTGGAGVAGNIYAGGNISTAGYFLGNAALLTGLPSSYGNTEVASYLPTYTGAFGNLSSGITASGPIRTTGIIFANASIASTSTTSGALIVTGGVGIGGNLFVGGALTESSSATLKENITPIDGALDLILQLTGVIYDRQDGSRKNEAGLIAEEVNKVLPNLITLDDQGTPMGVQYTKLTAYLIEAVKSLKAEIDQLKKRD